MRFVARIGCPAQLDGPTSIGGLERNAAIEFYADPSNADKSFAFEAYRHHAVKHALERMFGFKCAYCESDYSATQPPDVEHYRPKGEVLCMDGQRLRPGYYWLAATWSNLLPSCIDCNRARRQIVDDDDPRLLGKGNLFPLANESQRAARPGDEVNEHPLLLDPCRDEPDDHLEFVDAGVVRAACADSGLSRRGACTIEVVGLKRWRLTRKLAGHLKMVDAAVERYREAVEDLDADPTNGRTVERLKRESAELKRMMSVDAEYSLMATQRIRRALPALFSP